MTNFIDHIIKVVSDTEVKLNSFTEKPHGDGLLYMAGLAGIKSEGYDKIKDFVSTQGKLQEPIHFGSVDDTGLFTVMCDLDEAGSWSRDAEKVTCTKCLDLIRIRILMR